MSREQNIFSSNKMKSLFAHQGLLYGKNSFVGDQSFSTYARFSEKLIFLTPLYAHVRLRIMG